ncbi:IMPACT family protein [Aggregatibacter actinomycetemcomitans]|nr:IMPACT family protein [Aggregatibacter actinomycetemcomitans]QEH48973.1 IMPACT family protein [Aggregatibacter actinomycetemcomitans]TYA48567.1 IMPACT family protein [Aggregatibacter actinomycetemcomitans]TYA50283.1 IMPACT family protein [Aggregatibacter actinomycetemcomitans]
MGDFYIIHFCYLLRKITGYNTIKYDTKSAKFLKCVKRMIEYQIPKSAVDFSEGIKKNYFATVASQLNDSHRFGFSDNGKPSGTAGRPMLAALQGSGMGEIRVVVRYYGGVLLGIGGLVRANSGGVQ